MGGRKEKICNKAESLLRTTQSSPSVVVGIHFEESELKDYESSIGSSAVARQDGTVFPLDEL